MKSGRRPGQWPSRSAALLFMRGALWTDRVRSAQVRADFDAARCLNLGAPVISSEDVVRIADQGTQIETKAVIVTHSIALNEASVTGPYASGTSCYAVSANCAGT